MRLVGSLALIARSRARAAAEGSRHDGRPRRGTRPRAAAAEQADLLTLGTMDTMRLDTMDTKEKMCLWILVSFVSSVA
jgi:hypothetical protein